MLQYSTLDTTHLGLFPLNSIDIIREYFKEEDNDFFVYWLINQRGLFKDILLEKHQGYYLVSEEGIRGIHIFPRG